MSAIDDDHEDEEEDEPPVKQEHARRGIVLERPVERREVERSAADFCPRRGTANS
jgi:hypothetical protein